MTESECPCNCHGGPGAFRPACSIPGGCGPHTPAEPFHRCERGRRCYAYELHTDGQTRLGCPSDRHLCDLCEQAVARALDEAPRLYVDLRNATLGRGQGARTEMVTTSKGTPLPLNEYALHLGEDVHWLLTAWEDEVRVIARLSEAEREGKREGPQVQAAAQLLAAHLPVWLSAPTIAFAVARWVDELEQSGVEAACQLLEWRQQVRNLPGMDTTAPKAVRKYEHRCPACGVRAITHRAGDDLMQCQSCGATERYLPTLPQGADYADDDGVQRPALRPAVPVGPRGPGSDVAGQDARSGRAAHSYEEGSAA